MICIPYQSHVNSFVHGHQNSTMAGGNSSDNLTSRKHATFFTHTNSKQAIVKAAPGAMNFYWDYVSMTMLMSASI